MNILEEYKELKSSYNKFSEEIINIFDDVFFGNLYLDYDVEEWSKQWIESKFNLQVILKDSKHNSRNFLYITLHFNDTGRLDIKNIRMSTHNNQTKSDCNSLERIFDFFSQNFRRLLKKFYSSLDEKFDGFESTYENFQSQFKSLEEKIENNNQKIWDYKKGDSVELFNLHEQTIIKGVLKRKMPSINVIMFEDGRRYGFNGTSNILID